MKQYTKTIGLSGAMYTKSFDKIKHHKNKVRELNEATVAKAFLEGDATIQVIFEETGDTFIIDAFSSDESIKKYLGKAFIK
ncbi:hypothetical protein KHM83_02205 [Fusibacter paucivorans]|uniref:Uncharacterized protein n=1 Tax=Fusibacter paucivorans TaxID=76009 RepID=A0ABS5PKU5_9FIRM|nr:hypothetical protein [Fusibacter paucivorans]MBS7525487.1 hypothetical protein [Fusibacter paucivorans]